MTEATEKGDIYFFYRNKVDVERAESLKDIQRTYMILVPDDGKDKARMFIIGKKRMPKLNGDRSSAKEWTMNIMTGKPKEIGEELAPIEYETKTEGARRISAAFPVAEGRYALVQMEDQTELAWRMVNPEKPGKPQEEMQLKPEASYVISVRNPDIQVEGFPEERPDYPQSLRKLFAEKRWINISKPELLDYENAQLVMIGARRNLAELDVKVSGKPELFSNLGLDRKKWPTSALFESEFAETREALAEREPASDPSKGGHRGGREAVSSPSAAGVAKALKGVDLPKKKSSLVDYAQDHGADQETIDTLKALPDRKFNTMADVQKALAEVR